MPRKIRHATVRLLLPEADTTPKPRRRLDRRFLSVTLDYACLIGAPWWDGTRRTKGSFGHSIASPVDLESERLLRYAQGLAPALLRLGGSEADRIRYAPDHESAGDTGRENVTFRVAPPPGKRSERNFRSLLSRERWDEVCRFARRSGLDLFVTINAGAGPRDRNGRWDATNAEALVEYSARRRDPVSVWELGNEVNGFAFIHGWQSRVSAGRYAADFARFHDMIRRHAPTALTAGPASAYWPLLGEVLPVIPRFLRRVRRAPDVITWHYYPQQSSRGLLRTRRADPFAALKPRRLNGAARWARRVIRHARRPTNRPEVWLGETGHALYGGEPGVSDRFIAGLWWLDQLGLTARSGVRLVVRQSLVGGDYGLLDGRTFAPRPDYWNSLLWKRLMGDSVYAAECDGEPRLRVYAHDTPDRSGAVSFLLINLDRRAEIRVSLETGTLGFVPSRFEVYSVTASGPFAETLTINGTPPRIPERREAPPGGASHRPPEEPIAVPSLSYAFVVAVP